MTPPSLASWSPLGAHSSLTRLLDRPPQPSDEFSEQTHPIIIFSILDPNIFHFHSWLVNEAWGRVKHTIFCIYLSTLYSWGCVFWVKVRTTCVGVAVAEVWEPILNVCRSEGALCMVQWLAIRCAIVRTGSRPCQRDPISTSITPLLSPTPYSPQAFAPGVPSIHPSCIKKVGCTSPRMSATR